MSLKLRFLGGSGTKSCVESYTDNFVNLDDWNQFNRTGDNDFAIAVEKALLNGPEAASAVNTQMLNKKKLCGNDHVIELDVISLPDDVGAGTTDQVTLFGRTSNPNIVGPTAYIGRWINNTTPTGFFQIVEQGVGVLAQGACDVSEADYLKLTIAGTSITIYAEENGGVTTDSLNTTDSSIVSGHYAGLRCQIDEGARIEDSKTIIVDNFVATSS